MIRPDTISADGLATMLLYVFAGRSIEIVRRLEAEGVRRSQIDYAIAAAFEESLELVTRHRPPAERSVIRIAVLQVARVLSETRPELFPVSLPDAWEFSA